MAREFEGQGAAAGGLGPDGVAATKTAAAGPCPDGAPQFDGLSPARFDGLSPARFDGLPPAQGLYDPSREHDACGVGFIAQLNGIKSHSIVEDGLRLLENLEHRGAVGADPLMGDGAGMLVQIPHQFFAEEAEKLGFSLPEPGDYAVAFFFMPQDEQMRAYCEVVVENVVRAEGQKILGWRDVPHDNACLSQDPAILAKEPRHRQLFIARGDGALDQEAFERRLFIIRKVISNTVYARYLGKGVDLFYPVSMSSRTVIYKGMFLADQLGVYYSDLSDPRFVSGLALVHQRFSTNTFPSWKLAHPYRMVAHNGEINTLRGNVNWMAARQDSVTSPDYYKEDISKLWPISYEGQSDTACFDNALEFLVRGGYALEHAAMMLIPEAWTGNTAMDSERKAFYEYHAALMEPWDGPAAMAFTDGRKIGATLDRNGLRPARYLVTDDGRVVMASEAGVLPIPEEKIIRKWRLQPGRMLLIDLEAGRIIDDEEIKSELAKLHPYRDWLEASQFDLDDVSPVPAPHEDEASLLDRQQAFGYSQEDLKLLMAPMALSGAEAIGSMGTDTPIAALSDRPKLLYTYFKQNFAQVTNPPIDPIREETVMSLVSFIGPRPNILDHNGHSRAKRLEVGQPILTNEEMAKLRGLSMVEDQPFKARTFDILFDVETGPGGMMGTLDALMLNAEGAVREGANIIILSDRGVTAKKAPIPALLALAGVHHHLIRKGLRTSVGLVVESGEPREVHQFAVLAGYGAEAINPYLAFETLLAAKPGFARDVPDDKLIATYIKAIGKGLLKVMSKMGISTYQSYCGAQIFDAVGLSQKFVDEFFSGTATQIGGIRLEDVAHDSVQRHNEAFGADAVLARALEVGGDYAYRERGEAHMWTPQIIADLQHAVRGDSRERYQAFAKAVNEDVGRYAIRGHFHIKPAAESGREPVEIEEVEPASEIVKRFSTGAMSFGSISREAHTTLAIAMNRIGGRSNTGEGGEEAERFRPLANGDSLRSSIKQVASGRFGVTTDYLVNSDVMQIKVAQGAKPGEGGQLPGHKVDATIAKVRHSTPGVGLISPPPHHDIYSIEDLAQLIFDLKNVNPEADVSVKLVSEIGVGTVAAGVAKARADHITIAGYDGGTGASPLTSVKHAGSAWEMGLAETQQTLVLNGLRSRVVVQVDGGMRTGRDVVIGALLGADEIGFATAPLIAAGCVMMRKCHLNTCPVGIATQDPVLRARFKGMPEHVINYFFFVAEEVRELLAGMGFTKYDQIIGRSDLLAPRAEPLHGRKQNPKARGLDFSKIFYKPNAPKKMIRASERQQHPIDHVLDRKLIAEAAAALDKAERVVISTGILNSDRSTGAMLSGVLARRYGHAGLADDTIHIDLTGTAGQAFGAFLARGITLKLVGAGNDYVGKGLSGGRIIVRPDPAFKGAAEASIIVGNTVLYGATEGEVYFRGVAGERFSVRNSGAVAVVEGVGDHGCEYMTGGVVVVLGATGRNFAAGMSGGIAYVYDPAGGFAACVNGEMVDLEKVAIEGDDGLFATIEALKADMLGEDEKRLKTLVTRHMEETGSTLAAAILSDWEAARARFVKVMPREYRRALNEMRQASLAAAAE